jgi:hypothetical protein
MILYKLAGQRRPSNALVRHDVTDPKAELSRLLGVEVVDFKLAAEPEGAPVESRAPEPEPVVVPTVPPIVWPTVPDDVVPTHPVMVDFVFGIDIAPVCHPGGP